ncbi:unnamed protein product, partial [Strongylus vulgaris]
KKAELKTHESVAVPVAEDNKVTEITLIVDGEQHLPNPFPPERPMETVVLRSMNETEDQGNETEIETRNKMSLMNEGPVDWRSEDRPEIVSREVEVVKE